MGPHPVEVEMGLSAFEILDVIKRSDRCYQAVRGYIAERHLGTFVLAKFELRIVDVGDLLERDYSGTFSHRQARAGVW